MERPPQSCDRERESIETVCACVCVCVCVCCMCVCVVEVVCCVENTHEFELSSHRVFLAIKNPIVAPSSSRNTVREANGYG